MKGQQVETKGYKGGMKGRTEVRQATKAAMKKERWKEIKEAR